MLLTWKSGSALLKSASVLSLSVFVSEVLYLSLAICADCINKVQKEASVWFILPSSQFHYFIQNKTTWASVALRSLKGAIQDSFIEGSIWLEGWLLRIPSHWSISSMPRPSQLGLFQHLYLGLLQHLLAVLVSHSGGWTWLVPLTCFHMNPRKAKGVPATLFSP